jgi:hypothetical protein
MDGNHGHRPSTVSGLNSSLSSLGLAHFQSAVIERHQQIFSAGFWQGSLLPLTSAGIRASQPDDLEGLSAAVRVDLRSVPGGIRLSTSGFDICFAYPKSNNEILVSGEGV